MITDGDKDVLARLLDRLDQLEADNAQLRAVVDSLRRRRPEPSTPASGDDRGEVGPGEDHGQALSRRGMLSRLAGAAGLGLATGASVLAAKPAGATHAGSLQVGHYHNFAGTSSTGLESTAFTTFEASNDASGYGLLGQSRSGVGVGAFGGQAPLRLGLTGTSGPPATGYHSHGEVMLDVTGAMFVCRAAGEPGTWTRVGFNGVTPTRIADTRPGTGTPYSTGPIGPGAEREITVAGVAGVPAEAGGVVMNATAVSPTASSYLTIYPSGVTRPVASNLNVVAGGPPTPNQVTVKLGTAGKVRVFNNSGSVHVVLDLAGFFS